MLFRVTFDTKRGTRYVVGDAQWYADSLEESYRLITEYSDDTPHEFFASIHIQISDNNDEYTRQHGEWYLVEDGVHNEDPNLE
jgi:hypothetical protein